MGQVKIIPRSGWTSRQPRSSTPANHYKGVPQVWHWIGPGQAASGTQAGIAQVRAFLAYHMDSHGWNFLGYNFVILRDELSDGFSTVLEGRGDDVRGAHSGNNTANGYPGVLIMCGEVNPIATEAQLRTADALAIEKGWGRITGHQEWSPTGCPGPFLMPYIRGHRMPESPEPPRPYFCESEPVREGGLGPDIYGWSTKRWRDLRFPGFKKKFKGRPVTKAKLQRKTNPWGIVVWRAGAYGGIPRWRFENKEDRDAFVDDHPNWKLRKFSGTIANSKYNILP